MTSPGRRIQQNPTSLANMASSMLHHSTPVSKTGLHQAADHTRSGWKPVYYMQRGDNTAHKDWAGSSTLSLHKIGSTVSILSSNHAFTCLKAGGATHSRLLALITTPNLATPQPSLCTGRNCTECFFSEQKKMHNQWMVTLSTLN